MKAQSNKWRLQLVKGVDSQLLSQMDKPLVFLLLVSLFLGCSSNHYLSNENLSYLYDYKPQSQIKARVFYEDPKQPKLIAQIPKSRLEPMNSNRKSEAKTFSIKISYLIYQNYEYYQVLDSQSVTFKNKSQPEKSYIQYQFDLPPVKKRYLIALSVKDLVVEEKNTTFTYYQPYHSAGYQQIAVLDGDGHYQIQPYAATNDTFSLRHAEDTRTLVGNRFGNQPIQVAPPPFVQEYRNQTLKNLRKDSSFTVDTESPFSLKEQGLFAFAKGVNNSNNYNLLVTNQHFPEVNKVSQLVKGLIYLTPSESFNQMMKSNAPKKVVDSFWLKCAGGNKQRAKKLIQYYYNGMEQANAHFTTYKKGWKTDRGMIYMIFGAPYMVYRENDREIWLYPQSENFPELKFEFFRRSHPLCKEYYELKRTAYYRKLWFRAVGKWRNGEVRSQQKH